MKNGVEILKKELDTKCQKEVRGSISRFEKKNIENVVVGNPRVIKTKGSGKDQKRGKANPRFKSVREMIVLMLEMP